MSKESNLAFLVEAKCPKCKGTGSIEISQTPDGRVEYAPCNACRDASGKSTGCYLWQLSGECPCPCHPLGVHSGSSCVECHGTGRVAAPHLCACKVQTAMAAKGFLWKADDVGWIFWMPHELEPQQYQGANAIVAAASAIEAMQKEASK